MQQNARSITIVVLVLVSLFIGLFQQRLGQWWYERTKPTELPNPTTLDTQTDYVTKPNLPETEETKERKNERTEEQAEPRQQDVHSSISSSVHSLPDSLNLAVPFTSQAPHANWDARHEEYCEEASALMAGRYFQGRVIENPDDADAAMRELETWQLEHFGYFESTTAAETEAMIEDVYDLTVTIVSDVTADAMKQTLAGGSLVILPAAGRELGNPYFQRPGPIYHMLIVKGYTADGRFITNDPGTRRGADFVYTADRLLNAVGDYNHGDPTNGEKVMLVVTNSESKNQS